MQTEAWLRGPVEGIQPYLMPAAHALIQAAEDLETAAAPLSARELWLRPGGAASVGFHLRHIGGSTERLLTYARGEALSEAQRAAIGREGEPGDPPEPADSLLRTARAGIDAALRAIRTVDPESLLEPRFVGRARLPSTVVGLFFHIAEHTQRHTGQVITTARVVRSMAGWEADVVMRERVEAIRAACLAAGMAAYEDAGVQGLCPEGRWESAVSALRSLDLAPFVGE